MGRRDIPKTSETPDVEESRAALDVLEGQKNTAQTEVLAIAENKKELEEAFDVAKKRLDTELENKRAEVAREMQLLEDSITKAESNMEVVIQAKEKALDELADVEKSLTTAQGELENAQGEVSDVKSRLNDLMASENDLKETLKDYRADLKALQDKIGPLSKEVQDLEAKFAVMTREYSDASIKFESANTEHVGIVTSIDLRTVELSKLLSDITEKKTALDAASSELINVQKEVADQKQAMADKESAMNEKMGNLGRLEVRVEEKLAALDEVKKQFTSEHLERMGIK